MKKLSFILLLIVGMSSMAFAQSEVKAMIGVSGRMFAPACSNCTALYGPGFSVGYQLSSKIVGTFDLGIYSKSESSSTISATAFGLSADYYFKEAYNGFYISPDVTFITIHQKYNGTEIFSRNNLTIGLNLGWGIVVADRWRIIPHFGYGTWYEDSSGRITAGLKVGYRL